MKELITVAASFVIVVGLALFMYVGNKDHSTAVIKNQELKEVVDSSQKQIEDLKIELELLKQHVQDMDSIYHKKSYND